MLLGIIQIGYAQTQGGYMVAYVVQNVVLQNVTVPPMADQMVKTTELSDGTQVIDYKNGVRLILNADKTIEKLSADRMTRQVFVFKGNKTEISQYQEINGRTYCVNFKQNRNGDFVADTSKEVSRDALTSLWD
ncbi:MAG: hypothetical protein RIS47_320 [Bacteroidota bacterium]